MLEKKSTVTRRHTAVTLLTLAQLGLVTAACGSADAPFAQENTAVDAEAEVLSTVDAIKTLTSYGKQIGGYIAAVSGAIDASIALGKVLGLISTPSVDSQLAAIRSTLEAEAQDLDFRNMELERNMYFGDVHAAFIEALQTDVANGVRMPRNTGFNVTSANAMDSATGSVMFLRRYSPLANAGHWKDIAYLNTTTPDIYPGNLVFDWRISVPWYLNLVAMRLTTMAAVDPDFTTNHSFDQELTYIRSRLKDVLRLMVKDVRCSMLEHWGSGPGGEGWAYYTTEYGCADVNTGIQALAVWDVPNEWGTGSEPSEQWSQMTLDDLRRTVLHSMPQFDVQAMIDILWRITHPEEMDLAERFEEITLEAQPSLCVDLVGGNGAAGTPVQLANCVFSGGQWWRYDRSSGEIRNPAVNRCLEVKPTAYGPGTASWRAGATVQIGDCQSPLPEGQQWTWDPESKLLRNGVNTFLDVQWGNLSPGVPVWLWDQNNSAAQRWHADTALGFSANPPTECGTLHAGEGLFAGQELLSCDQRFKLRVEDNGNVKLYQWMPVLTNPPVPPGGFPPPNPKPTQYRFIPIWETGTGDRLGNMLIMQNDGNLVLYSWLDAFLWHTNTWSYPGSRTVVQNDGNFVVYTGNTPVWASNTCCR